MWSQGIRGVATVMDLGNWLAYGRKRDGNAKPGPLRWYSRRVCTYYLKERQKEVMPATYIAALRAGAMKFVGILARETPSRSMAIVLFLGERKSDDGGRCLVCTLESTLVGVHRGPEKVSSERMPWALDQRHTRHEMLLRDRVAPPNSASISIHLSDPTHLLRGFDATVSIPNCMEC